MRRHKSKSLQWHFLTRSLFVSLSVLSATLLALLYLATSYNAYSNQVRNIELARAIDNIAMVTAGPEHVQQFVDSSMPNGMQLSIRVIDKADRRIIATNRPEEYQSLLSELQDPELTSLAMRALRSAVFDPDLHTGTGRHLTVLPLTSARHALSGNFVLQHAKAIKPSWHHELQALPDTLSTWLSHMLHLGSTDSRTVFTAPQAKFAGVIIIESHNPWLNSLMSGAFYSTALLICSGFIAVVLSGWHVCQRYVLSPVNALSAVLKQQRTGNAAARADRSFVTEFDQFARQWNGLLNYRQAAEERHRVLSKVLEAAPIGVEVTTPDALIEYANPAYLEMTGYSLIDVIGKTPRQLLASEKTSPSVFEAGQKALLAGRTWHAEYTSRRKNGTQFINEVTLCPVMSEEGKLERIVAVSKDITKRKEYERGLIEARQVSEAAEKSTSEFIARMSHELRTPFNAIIGFADIIAKQQLGPIGNDSYIEFATIIEQSAQGLLGIINSIIDLSRMAAGQRPLNEAPVNLALLTERVVDTLGDYAASQDITLDIHEKLAGYKLNADRALLEQLISNLISNAIKFNHPNGRVDIKLRRDRQSRIVLEIKDTGIGIHKSELKNAVEPFVQLNTGYNRQYEGIGLGLTLAKNQAAVHNAELKITSRKQHGTTVKVVFPDYRTIKPENSKHPSRKPTRNARPAANAA